LDANTDDITELSGATNKFYADSLVDAHLSAGTGIAYTAGVIAFNADTDDVAEGANLSSLMPVPVMLSVQTQQLETWLQYDNTTGEILVALV
jgi:hypothetical protein